MILFCLRSTLKKLEHLSHKETKDKSCIILIWAVISANLTSKTKERDAGRSTGNSVSGDFSSEVPGSTVISAGRWEVLQRGPLITHGALTPSKSWAVYSRILSEVQCMEKHPAQPLCPINLKGKAEPLFSHWKSLQGAEQHLHPARQVVTRQTNRYWDGKQVHLAQ